MASFISPVEKIDNLVIQQLPSNRPINVTKAVRVNRITVLIAENGYLYSDQLQKFCYTPGNWPWQDSLMKALKRLGVINKEQMDEHILYGKQAEQSRTKASDKDYLELLAKRYSFSLTQEQHEKLS